MGAKASELFIKSHDFSETKLEVKEIIDNLKLEMKKLIQKSDWLDEGKIHLRVKSCQVKFCFGFFTFN